MGFLNQPMYQRAMQRHLAKASMRGQRPNEFAVQAKFADQDLARRQQFRDIQQTKQRSDLAHRGRMANLNMAKKDLKTAKKQLPWELGIGAAGALYSTVEGRRRAKATEALAEQQRRILRNIEIDRDTNTYRLQDLARYGGIPNFK